jgi:hypothetical protein
MVEVVVMFDVGLVLSFFKSNQLKALLLLSLLVAEVFVGLLFTGITGAGINCPLANTGFRRLRDFGL